MRTQTPQEHDLIGNALRFYISVSESVTIDETDVLLELHEREYGYEIDLWGRPLETDDN